MLFRSPGSAWRFLALFSTLAITPRTALAQPAFLVKDINTTQPGASSMAPGLGILNGNELFAEHGGRLLFGADDGVSGKELWVSDGTPGGTTLLVDILSGSASSEPEDLTALPGSGLTLFRAAETLYKTDGTAAGTESLPAGTQTPRKLTPVNGSMFFIGGDSLTLELWKSDGTPGGTGQVPDIPPGSFGPSPIELEGLGDTLFFSADDSFFGGMELWKSDGTPGGTVRVKDIRPDGHSVPGNLTDVDGTLFFAAFIPETGRELWKSDGTEAGTVLVKDIWPGSSYSIEAELEERFTAVLGGTLFFTAKDGVSGLELWKSDGTEAGTVRVKDIFPGPGGSIPFRPWLTRAGSRVYFLADDGVHGLELWVSDGTEAGTRMVADLFPGAASSMPQHLEAVGHVLLFSANDGTHGVEAWRTNGTAAGTRMIQDIAPGARSATPAYFTSAGSHVFFGADDGTTGFELWAVPRPSVLATFGDVPVGHWSFPFVEALAGAGLTGGCGTGQFCPEINVSRAETAVFLLRGIHGLDFVPSPATGTVFQDVPASYWAAPWIERFAADGFTSGCSLAPPLFCPAQPLNRDQMAVFLLKAKHGSSYTPPPATGTVFSDVPASYWAAPWIERLAAEGITAGCAPGVYCPGDPVTRAQMAVFLTRTFNLPLP